MRTQPSGSDRLYKVPQSALMDSQHWLFNFFLRALLFTASAALLVVTVVQAF